MCLFSAKTVNGRVLSLSSMISALGITKCSLGFTSGTDGLISETSLIVDIWIYGLAVSEAQPCYSILLSLCLIQSKRSCGLLNERHMLFMQCKDKLPQTIIIQ